jgi:hypothetical protein
MDASRLRELALAHALRADIALMPASGLAPTGIDDAVKRALPSFTLDDNGNVTTATGDTLEEVIAALRETAPHLFAAQKPQRPAHLGKIGDGRSRWRLDWANQASGK